VLHQVRFEPFMVAKIQVEVFCIVMPCSLW